MLEGDPRWNALTRKVLGACYAVHTELGPGLLESVYEEALVWELGARDVPHERQATIPIFYRGKAIGSPLRLDVTIPDTAIVEIKAVDSIHPIHRAQLITYLKLTGIPIGLLINFNVIHLKDGIERIMNTRPLRDVKHPRFPPSVS